MIEKQVCMHYYTPPSFLYINIYFQLGTSVLNIMEEFWTAVPECFTKFFKPLIQICDMCKR